RRHRQNSRPAGDRQRSQESRNAVKGLAIEADVGGAEGHPRFPVGGATQLALDDAPTGSAEAIGVGEASREVLEIRDPRHAAAEWQRQAEGKIAAEGGIGLGGDELDQGRQALRAIGGRAGQGARRLAGEQLDRAARSGPRLGQPNQVSGPRRAAEIDAEEARSRQGQASCRSTRSNAAPTAARRTAVRSPENWWRSTSVSRDLRATAR